jgi:hypothetical protein
MSPKGRNPALSGSMDNTKHEGNTMTTTVFFKCDNDCFLPDPGVEVARILRKLADQVEDGLNDSTKLTINDINGNKIGYFLTEE